MKRAGFYYKVKKLSAAVLAFFAAALLLADSGHVQARDNLKEASYCSFVIPPEFVPGGEKGLFVNKNHPMESSTITYSVYDNGLDRMFTNREKQGEAIKASASVSDETVSLTGDIYQETMQAAYNSEYGQDVGYKVESFDRITVDGFPGYRIVASYQAGDEEKIHQTVYMLLSKYRTFTISMQRAEDDDCEAFFKECSDSIHVH